MKKDIFKRIVSFATASTLLCSLSFVSVKAEPVPATGWVYEETFEDFGVGDSANATVDGIDITFPKTVSELHDGTKGIQIADGIKIHTVPNASWKIEMKVKTASAGGSTGTWMAVGTGWSGTFNLYTRWNGAVTDGDTIVLKGAAPQNDAGFMEIVWGGYSGYIDSIKVVLDYNSISDVKFNDKSFDNTAGDFGELPAGLNKVSVSLDAAVTSVAHTENPFVLKEDGSEISVSASTEDNITYNLEYAFAGGKTYTLELAEGAECVYGAFAPKTYTFTVAEKNFVFGEPTVTDDGSSTTVTLNVKNNTFSDINVALLLFTYSSDGQLMDNCAEGISTEIKSTEDGDITAVLDGVYTKEQITAYVWDSAASGLPIMSVN